MQQEFEVHHESPGNKINTMLDLVVIPDHDPVEVKPCVIFVHDPIAPEHVVITIHDFVAPEPTIITFSDSVAQKEQHVTTTLITTGHNILYREKYLVESPDLDES